MVDNFDQCLAETLKHEGGFVQNPVDPGGATNRGVTKQTWEEWVGHEVNVADIKALTVEDVEPLYRREFWDACQCDLLAPGVDFVVFDVAVNSGTKRAAKLLQQVVGVEPDGAIGPRTLAAANSIGANLLVNKLCDKRQAFWQSLKTFPVFGKGWTRRGNEVRAKAIQLANKV